MSERLAAAVQQLADEEVRSLRAENARLRLTDAERRAVEKAAWYVEAMASGDLAGTIPPTLRGLLERTKGGGR